MVIGLTLCTKCINVPFFPFIRDEHYQEHKCIARQLCASRQDGFKPQVSEQYRVRIVGMASPFVRSLRHLLVCGPLVLPISQFAACGSDGPRGEPDLISPTFAGLESATGISSTTITLHWSRAEDDKTAPEDIVYDICVSTEDRACAEIFVSTKSSQPGEISTAVGSLQPMTQYHFVARARDREGNSDSNSKEISATTIGPGAYRSVAVGPLHTCAVLLDGQVACWGLPLGYLWGFEPFEPREQTCLTGGSDPDEYPCTTSPTILRDVQGAIQVTFGWTHACALLGSGQVLCWGANAFGQTGTPRGLEASVLAGVVSFLSRCAESPARKHSLSYGAFPHRVPRHVVRNDPAPGRKVWQKVFRRGISSARGQVDRQPADEVRPSFVQGIEHAVSISAGLFHTCALISDGQVKCWGHAGNGELGIPQGEWPLCDNGDKSGNLIYCTHQPTLVPLPSSAESMAAAGQRTCIVDPDGQAWCWGAWFGDSNSAFCGIGERMSVQPVPVSSLTDAIEISVAEKHACAITGHGKVFCWGDNSSGQFLEPDATGLGEPCYWRGNEELVCPRPDGTEGTYGSLREFEERISLGSPPIQIETLTNAVRLSLGATSTCAITQDNRVKCLGFLVGREQVVPLLADVLELGIGHDRNSNGHACALLHDGNLYCWGDNQYGYIGDGTTEYRREPILIRPPNVPSSDS